MERIVRQDEDGVRNTEVLRSFGFVVLTGNSQGGLFLVVSPDRPGKVGFAVCVTTLVQIEETTYEATTRVEARFFNSPVELMLLLSSNEFRSVTSFVVTDLELQSFSALLGRTQL